MPDECLPGALDSMRDALLAWYAADHRALPWRDTTDPYEILVAEVMSQQTQLERVVDAWEAFLERWPTVAALADTPRAEVVAFWSDHRLGYNRRARFLHESASIIAHDWDGSFPREPDELERLPGVGPYTANAVASFAFNNGDAVVDTNVKRILFRLCTASTDREPSYERLASRLMPPATSRQWNNAMMELGGVVCEKRPRCDEGNCPWRRWCDAYATGDFTAPDVPSQPTFDGSRRQFRGRIVRIVSEAGRVTCSELGPRVRVDFDPADQDDRSWLRDLVESLAADGLVRLETATDEWAVAPVAE